jgi:hypothetical protein
MKRTMTCVTSLTALMLAAPIAFAQDKPGRADDRAPSQMDNKAGGSERGQERSGGQRNDNAGDTARERAGSNAERGQSGGAARDQAKDQRKDASDNAKDQRKDAKDDRKDAQDSAKDQRKDAKDDRKSGDDDAKRGDRNERAGSDQDRTKNKDKAEDQNQQNKSRDRASETESDRQRTQDQARDRDQAKDRQSDQAKGEVREEDRQKAEQVRSKVDTEKRERVRNVAFRGDVRRANNVDVRIDIGVRLPRRVDVYDLPSDVIEIVPAYRGYRYVVVGEDYCIVDPETYVIVDVIHRGGGDGGQYAYRTGGGSARLELTNDQIEIIRREIRDRGRKFDYEGDLEVGIKLPGDFAFEPFPEMVVREVPVVSDYRFVHIEDEIAIVAKDQPEVVYVIED